MGLAVQDFMLRNQTALLVKGVLYPSTGLIQKGHSNLVFELAGDSKFRKDAGDIEQLVQRCLEFKERKPEGIIVLSSLHFVHLGYEQFYELISQFSQLSEIRIFVTVVNQETCLEQIWKGTVQDGVKLVEWINQVVADDIFHLQYDKTIKKLERLVNARDIDIINVNNMNNHQLIRLFLERLGVMDRSAMQFSDLAVKYSSEIHLTSQAKAILQKGNEYVSMKYQLENPLTF